MSASRRAVTALSALIVAVMLGGMLTAYAAGTGTVTPPPTTAFLARADNPADALAAGPIAGRLGAPLFTTPSNTLDPHAQAGLVAHNPELVILTGGTAALSADVEAQVRAALPAATVRRVSGAGRTETARKVADLINDYAPRFLPVDATALEAVEAQTAHDADALDGLDSTAFAPDSEPLDVDDAVGPAYSSPPITGTVQTVATLTIEATDECGDGSTQSQFLVQGIGTAYLQGNSGDYAFAAAAVSLNGVPVSVPDAFGTAYAEVAIAQAGQSYDASSLSPSRILHDMPVGTYVLNFVVERRTGNTSYEVVGPQLIASRVEYVCAGETTLSSASAAAEASAATSRRIGEE